MEEMDMQHEGKQDTIYKLSMEPGLSTANPHRVNIVFVPNAEKYNK